MPKTNSRLREQDYLDRFHEVEIGLGLSREIANKIANFIHYEMQMAKKAQRTSDLGEIKGIAEGMRIERIWAMPNKWTFRIKPIAELLKEEMNLNKEVWLDPFAGMNSPAQYRNDLNEEMNAQDHEDAIEWLKKKENADGILLDPPYSNRQVSEHYKAKGIKVTGWHTSAGWTSEIKDEVARATKIGGKVICFGWNSMGLGKGRGFRMKRILLVPHGGSKNDTIVTVEIKTSLTSKTKLLVY